MSDIALPHTTIWIIETVRQLHFEVLEYPSYSPDIASLDCYIMGSLRHTLIGQQFAGYQVMKEWACVWLTS